MTLSKFTVDQIVLIVAADSDSNSRVNSWLGKLGTSGAGATRNFAMALAGGLTGGKVKALDPSEKAEMAYLYSCDGIAEATSKAINAKISTVSHLVSVCAQARRKGYNHTGTLLEMDDGSKYVLDWWKSLSIRNPVVFQYLNFMDDLGGGILYDDFKGFP